jgi:hypothetical protein
MLGNVFEWTASDYQETYDGSELKSSKSRELKAYRGGSFNTDDALVRCSARAGMPPDLACNQIGFRLCVEVERKSPKIIKPDELSGEINKLRLGETKSFKVDLSSLSDLGVTKKPRKKYN